jgi:hypothetical protein
MVVRLLPLPLLALLLLSGCLGAGGTDSSGPNSTTRSDSPPPSGGNDDTPAPVEPAAPPESIVQHCRIALNGTKALHEVSGGLTLGEQCPWPDAIQSIREQMHSAIVEVAWTSLQPTILDVRLSANLPDCSGFSAPAPGFQAQCTVAATVGSVPPLRLELLEEHLARDRSRTLDIAVSPRGVFVDQQFMVAITLFPNVAPPPNYTALG